MWSPRQVNYYFEDIHVNDRKYVVIIFTKYWLLKLSSIGNDLAC